MTSMIEFYKNIVDANRNNDALVSAFNEYTEALEFINEYGSSKTNGSARSIRRGNERADAAEAILRKIIREAAAA